MLEQVMISTQNAKKLMPLLHSALEREEKLLSFSIRRTLDALKIYEDRHRMSSDKFERLFLAKEIEESLDYLDWWMELEALHHLEEQRQTLTDAKFI